MCQRQPDSTESVGRADRQAVRLALGAGRIRRRLCHVRGGVTRPVAGHLSARLHARLHAGSWRGR